MASISSFKASKPIFLEVNEEDKQKLEKWNTIRTAISQIEQLPASHLSERKIRSLEISTQIDELGPFFEKYPLLLKDYFKTSKILFRLINSQEKPIENAAKIYFEKLFAENNIKIQKINFSSKPGGIQLGRKMLIEYSKENPQEIRKITYFIKTHQFGSKSGQCSTRPIDPKEIFVYKMLEYIGLGPKAHFFFNLLSQGGLYIATQDAGYSKSSEKQKAKQFKTYELLKKELQNPPTQEVMKCLTQADIISRIFSLRDVTINDTNFGLVQTHEKNKCKIVDFRIETQNSYEYIDIFKGYLDGNGLFNYCDELLIYILKTRSKIDRVRTADEILKELASGGKRLPLASALEKACKETVEYFNANNTLLGKGLTDDPKEDFNMYVKSIQTNFAKFLLGVQNNLP